MIRTSQDIYIRECDIISIYRTDDRTLSLITTNKKEHMIKYVNAEECDKALESLIFIIDRLQGLDNVKDEIKTRIELAELKSRNRELQKSNELLQEKLLKIAYLNHYDNPDKMIDYEDGFRNSSIDVLGFDGGILNALKRASISRVGDLLQLTRDDLDKIRSISSVRISQIEEILSNKGLSLKMEKENT